MNQRNLSAKGTEKSTFTLLLLCSGKDENRACMSQTSNDILPKLQKELIS
jgi:hypothetical protein